MNSRLVVRDLGAGIPVLQTHGGIELRLGRPRADGHAVAPGHLVGEHQQQEILVRHFLLAGQGEALGEGVQDAGRV